MDTEKKIERLKLISEEVSDKYKVQIIYVQVKCVICGRVHGINPNSITGEIRESQLRCFKCVTEEYEKYEELIKKTRKENLE